MKRIILGALATGALALTIGCGGSGVPATGSGGRVTTYFTDDMGTNDHVWVKVHKVELVTTSGGTETVFEDTVGREIDLRTLRDGTGARFAFVGAENAPAGTYQGVRVTMDRNLTIYPPAATVGSPRSFDPSFLVPGGSGHVRADMAFASPIVIGSGAQEVVVDFDLSQWDDTGTLVSPVLVPGGTSGLNDEARHERHSFHGTISSLAGTSPDQSFTLTVRPGFTFTVMTSSATAIYFSSGTGSPTLTNGQTVEVKGVYSRTADAFKAHSVKIRSVGDHRGGAEIHGAPSNIGTSQFDVTVRSARGFIPPATVIHVTFGSGTRFFSDGGVPIDQATFLLGLATSPGVEAEGTFVPLTRTLAATKLKLDDEDGEHEAEARGAPSAIDAGARTFKVTLSAWAGFSGSVGALLDVHMISSATFRDAGGNEVNAATFFAALATAPAVEVEGTLQGTVFHARKAKIED